MDMKTLMRNQIQEALKYKWFKGTEIGRDPGEEAVNEWIEKYAVTFRKEYDECFAVLVTATLQKSLPKVQEIFPGCGREALSAMAGIILEEFTKIWFLEMAKTEHNNHIEEI